ncbi:hypothetical protein [Arthrobacter oryzae]|uniref:hypothetical protein n=1 Tax=Arthrobacter oryzae TaxID=409290 RepID=UPI002784F5B5|nr:hypothetical protein [Arthrobacter oryzae]MDQ0079492.1 hypothetical protein [Arthrobacter oryzae]
MSVLRHSLTVPNAVGAGVRAEASFSPWLINDDFVRGLGDPVVVPVVISGKTYSATVADSIFWGAAPANTWTYFAGAIDGGMLDWLTTKVSLIFWSGGRQLLGSVDVSALVLPAVGFGHPELGEPDDLREIQQYGLFFANAESVVAKLADLKPKQRSVFLMVLCLCTMLDAGIPRFVAPDDTRMERWGDDGQDALAWVEDSWDTLVDIPVRLPEPARLTVAGTVEITGEEPVAAMDFAKLKVSAQWSDAAGAAVERTRSFDESVTVEARRVVFDLTGSDPVFQTSVAGPVRVSVRGLSGISLFSQTYEANDKALTELLIKVSRQHAGTLEPLPQPVPDANLRLRGRVLVIGTACPSAKVTVLVNAKAEAEDEWRLVGASTTDAGGNFTMPYPLGTYKSAQAVCSLAPEETADIPIVADSGWVTISPDFLWLAINNPVLPDKPCGGKGSEACPCGAGDSPSRVPDFSDVIGNDDYSQDLGTGCINLSKPNRTINEFRYQAIVRTSDPDVATYALERHEQSLNLIDPRLTELSSMPCTNRTHWCCLSTLATGTCSTYPTNAKLKYAPLRLSDAPLPSRFKITNVSASRSLRSRAYFLLLLWFLESRAAGRNLIRK